MDAMTFGPGQIVGEYRVEALLGRGGLGAVYRVTHLISRRAEAMKVLLPEQTGTPDMMERFRREIQLLAALNHPNIAALHNAFAADGQLIMVMELVEGEDLRSRSRRTRIPIAQLLDYAGQVLSALEYAHATGIVHRDIKPANIMVTASGAIKLLDFGIATKELTSDLTVAGAVIGSPTHMSPEQVRGERATPRSDFYSLGVTLYELIAGQPPIRGGNTYELMMGHIHQVPVPLSTLRSDIPVALSSLIAKALEKDPTQRFANATEFLAALRAAAAADPAEGATTAQLAPSWQRVSTDEFNKPTTAATLPPTGSVATGPALPVEPVIRSLAAFIGPIAKIVVTRLAKQCTDLDQLYLEASKQIDNDADRQRFLRSRSR